MPHIKYLAAAPAMIAALSLAIPPAAAAELPRTQQAPSFSVPHLDQVIENAQTAENHRHRRYHRYHHRRGPGLGDVLAGVLIVGAIAHVANSSRNDRRDRDRDYRRDVRWDDNRGIDRAVSICVDAIERDVRVETVDRVDRTARGWQVAGTVYNGDAFTCRIGENGRIEDIDFGGSGARYQDDDRDDDRYEDIDYQSEPRADDRQWDDDRYATEWSRVDQGTAPRADQEAPAYPGGPIDGEDTDVDADLEVGTGYPGAGS